MADPSHIDTFDPKPKLNQMHMTEFRAAEQVRLAHGKRQAGISSKSPFKFRKAGPVGRGYTASIRALAGCVDDICFYRGAVGENTNHPPAPLSDEVTGNAFGGDRGHGSLGFLRTGHGE